MTQVPKGEGEDGIVAFTFANERINKRLSARADAELLATDMRAVSREGHVDGKFTIKICRSKIE